MTIFYWFLKFVSPRWIVIYWISGIENLFCLFLFAWTQPKRKWFWVYFPLTVIGYFGIGALLGVLRNIWSDSVVYYVLSTFFYQACLYPILLACFKGSPLTDLLDWVGSICVREVTTGFFTFLSLVIGVENRTSYFLFPDLDPLLNCILYDFMHAAFIVPLSLFFRRYHLSLQDKSARRRIAVLSGITVITLLITRPILIWYSSESLALNITATFLSMVMAVVLLVLRTDFLIGDTARQEALILNQVLESERKEYEASRESIRSINAKMHDIKHVLERYGDKLALEDLSNMKAAVASYDSQLHTGNEVLDTLLYSKSMLCREKKIQLSVLADGKAVSFLETSVCYYLFTNILDNAIEAVEKVENPEERLISLTVNEIDGKAHIECSNYFIGKLSFAEDGSLQTTKKDKESHGYGSKSIRLLVQQLKGDIHIQTHKNIFYLTIDIPEPVTKEKKEKVTA